LLKYAQNLLQNSTTRERCSLAHPSLTTCHCSVSTQLVNRDSARQTVEFYDMIWHCILADDLTFVSFIFFIC